MPETESSSSTGQMNYHVVEMLRDYACQLRKAHANGADIEALQAMKAEQLSHIYRMLCIHLGEPPQQFEWQWRDKDREFHRAGTLTPTQFYEKYVNTDLKKLVCLIHDPRPEHPCSAVYTVKYLGNVVGGRPTEYLNTTIDVIKQAAIAQLEDGESVWFGCDVGKYLDRDTGVMDMALFDYELIYGVKPTMDKADRLNYGHSLMTHAMVFTGVDLDDEGKSRKWRVENSWGEKGGDKGFYGMTDAWFDEFNYEVVVHRKYLPDEFVKLLDREPVGLEPWDPMGSLA